MSLDSRQGGTRRAWPKRETPAIDENQNYIGTIGKITAEVRCNNFYEKVIIADDYIDRLKLKKGDVISFKVTKSNYRYFAKNVVIKDASYW